MGAGVGRGSQEAGFAFLEVRREQPGGGGAGPGQEGKKWREGQQGMGPGWEEAGQGWEACGDRVWQKVQEGPICCSALAPEAQELSLGGDPGRGYKDEGAGTCSLHRACS